MNPARSRLRDADSAHSSFRDVDSIASDETIPPRFSIKSSPRGRMERRETDVTLIAKQDQEPRVNWRADRQYTGTVSRYQYPSDQRRSAMFERHRHFVRSLCPLRYIIVAMGSAGLAIVYGVRVHLDIFFIMFVNHSAVFKGEIGHFCSRTVEKREDGPFKWDAATQRVLVASYNLGFIASHIPGAFMAMKSSTKWMVFSSVIAAMVMGGVIPVLTSITDWELVSFFLLLQGLCGGILVPCLTTIIANWAPPFERSLFGGFVYGGLALGQAGTWAAVNIVTWEDWKDTHQYMLLCSLPWLLLWGLWGNSSPISSLYITQAERSYILLSQQGTRSYGTLYFPFGDIRTSVPFWVLTCAHFGAKCMYYMLFFELPRYLLQVLHVDYYKLKFWIVPSIALFAVSIVSGRIMDLLVERRKFDATLTRKLGAAIGIFVPSACLFALCFTSCDLNVILAIFTVSAAALGTLCGTIGVNHIDLAPNFAGALMGITGTLAGIPTLIVPTFMGSLTLSESKLDIETKWIAAFATVALVCVLCCIVYIVWATAETQPWNSGRRPSSMGSGDLESVQS